MKRTATLSLILALSASSFALAQSAGMKDMEKKDMGMQKCMDMKEMTGSDMKGMDMKGMDMKDMDAQKCKDMMNGKDGKHHAKAMTHKAVAGRTRAEVRAEAIEHAKKFRSGNDEMYGR